MIDILLSLESKVYLPEVRRSPELSAPLFAEDFVEFGSNGQIFDKAGIVRVLAEGAPIVGTFTIEDFAVKPLADGLALATYRLDRLDEEGILQGRSLRSSIYRQSGGVWSQIFHQGTPISLK